MLVIAGILLIGIIIYRATRPPKILPEKGLQSFHPLFTDTGKVSYSDDRGMDIIVNAGEIILSPFNAVVYTWFYLERSEKKLTGIELIGPENITVKLMNVVPLTHKVVNGRMLPYSVNAGEPAGLVQNLAVFDPGIENHVHIEVLKTGKHIDPTTYIKL